MSEEDRATDIGIRHHGQKFGKGRVWFRRYMHCQWGRKPLPVDKRCGLSSTCQRRTELRTEATCTKKLVTIARVVPEISSRTDRPTDRHTHHNTSQPLPRAKWKCYCCSLKTNFLHFSFCKLFWLRVSRWKISQELIWRLDLLTMRNCAYIQYLLCV